MTLSPRLRAVVDALPLRPGLRVLEIGCGPGAAAREVARRVPDGRVLGVDRSPRAIAAARAANDLGTDRLDFRCVAVEDLRLDPDEPGYDLAFAVRVGALDGRHPELAEQALRRLAAVLVPGAPLLVDGGDPLRALPLPPPG
ncbi:class I SAM-dependent methyltransferase [Auraticoccus monumenti]|uniref:Methyltransferase domain-containing protein n=1 Tax=Auraticoccus monumenti TaxID=675864 RepID=A0A1G7ETC5_9ACTN|nr:class I SAM-dependent methyltransferase [Auraticoccus monumenti]SDE66943.1 Methyltransferase domain-containing protein [Auraticoccus monumenti]